MAALAQNLREDLADSIRDARIAAEAGAKAAIDALTVAARDPHSSLSEEQKSLRKKLRAHARQLGDARDAEKGTQAVARLVREVAYEHWHRMLFARFLAENGLLVEPKSGVAVSLNECEELAREAGVDRWALAASFAAKMLPQIFRADDPSLAVALPPEKRQDLERLLAELPAAIFIADDSLGWTYQFWQSVEKKVVNDRMKSGEKITGETLPAVTQLFTEHYMVLFLLHNTLGAWHAAKVLETRPDLVTSATSEAELRAAAAEGLDGDLLDYLRFVREPSESDGIEGTWCPAGGRFETWPRKAAEITVLDPCCGSGHFLVAAFELLVRLRRKEEGLALEPAIRAVIEQNLFGLELDARCTQIAAFNVALSAWRWVGKPIELPRMNIACCGLGPAAPVDEWVRLADDLPASTSEGERLRVRNSLRDLHGMFSTAPELGSLIDPRVIESTPNTVSFAALQPIVERILDCEQGDESRERAVAASGMARAAETMVGPRSGYTLVVTNVPYLGRNSHADGFTDWVDSHHKDAKNDLATVYISRMLRFVGVNGTISAVTPQNWLFLTSYYKLRETLLRERTWRNVARLGAGAFETIGGQVVKVALVIISGSRPGVCHAMTAIDVSGSTEPVEKAVALRAGARVKSILQSEQLDNPDARVLSSIMERGVTLQSHADAYWGHGTGDHLRYVRLVWEIAPLRPRWSLLQSAVEATSPYGGRSSIVLWEEGGPSLLTLAQALRAIEGHSGIRPTRGSEAWGRIGICVTLMNTLSATIYTGEIFDANCAAVIPKDASKVLEIWRFCSSETFPQSVREIDGKMNVMNHTLLKVRFDIDEWTSQVIDELSDLPQPQSNEPPQWLFHGHPAGMLAAGLKSRSPVGIADTVGADRHPSLICREPNPRDVLQVAVARLLGYRWPAELDESMRLDIAARAWVERCRDLASFADEDGIVCLEPVRGEPSAAERLRRLLVVAFVDVPGGFSAARERELLVAAAGDQKPAPSLEEWLKSDFFEQHCELFHQRPFVWHIWDGRDDGFHALVNYHRLAGPEGEGRRTLDKLASTYLKDWIDIQKDARSQGEEGADGRVVAALALQVELNRILEGEFPYDIFVRWKPLRRQPLGWEPDIDDGVRLNIRPFLRTKDVGRKGAGILRAKPNVKWTKDRGKEPESLRPRGEYPWFWGCDPEGNHEHRVDFGAPPQPNGKPRGAAASERFDGQRWNDLHYTRAAKEVARASLEVLPEPPPEAANKRAPKVRQKEIDDDREP